MGAHPDYLLTVWDWENELMILRTKAFSQEVFKVSSKPTSTSGVDGALYGQMTNTHQLKMAMQVQSMIAA